MSVNISKLSAERKDAFFEICNYIPPKYAFSIEEEIYKHSLKYVKSKDIKTEYFNKFYNSLISDICFNLNQNNSPSFVIRIIKNEIPISSIPTLKYTEIDPDKWKNIISKIEYAEYKRNNMATTFAYVCRKCGGNKHTVFSMQTRSCDEPMTIFVTCQDCKFQFRQ